MGIVTHRDRVRARKHKVGVCGDHRLRLAGPTAKRRAATNDVTRDLQVRAPV